MAKRIMSEAEVRRRKKLQGEIGRTTSTLGLSGLAVTGAAAVAAKKPGLLKKIPKAKNLTPEKMRNYAINTGIVSGGIGGVGGFNQASIYSTEARRRKTQVPVKKEFGMEMGFYGEEGRPLTHEQIEAEIEKAWTPSASNFDAEKSRKKRTKGYESASLVGAGAGGAYAAHHGMKAAHEGAFKPREMAPVTQKKVNAAGDIRPVPHWKAHGFLHTERAVGTKGLKSAGKAGVGIAAVAGAAATHSAIKRKRKSGWASYEKRDTTSAFGIDHNDEVVKAFGGVSSLLKSPTSPVKQFSQGFKQAKPLASAMKTNPGMKLNKPTRAGMFVSRNKKPLGAAGVVAGGAGVGSAMAKPKRTM